MMHEELLSLLSALRRAQIGSCRAPHKPLLTFWLLRRFATREHLGRVRKSCTFCGFDGALSRSPVGLEAAHVRWRS